MTRFAGYTSFALGVAALCLLTITCSKNGVGDDNVVDDGTAPKTVTDLSVASFSDTSVTLTWTATGDDSTVGTAAKYDLRISDEMIHYGNFDSATALSGLPNPKPSGQHEQFQITGLKADSTYYFALRVLDENGNFEGVSNCVHATCFNDYAVSIPDTSLEAAIRAQINKPTGDLLKSDLWNMTELWGADRSIVDLTGLETCADLSILNLSNNSITDLSSLSHLDALTQLNIGGNDISSLSPISGLTVLTSLRARTNEIADITPLSSLTNLVTLDLGENNIVNIVPLQGLSNLTWLNLEYNQVVDISSMAALTNLTDLNLSNNKIADLSALSGLTHISNLNVSSNRITDIAPLVANSGIGSGDYISLLSNPLQHESIVSHIPTLRSRGATVQWVDNTIPPWNVSDLAVDSVTASTVTLSWSAPGEDYLEGTAYLYEIRYSKSESDIENWSGGQIVSNPPAPDTAGTRQSVMVSGLLEDTVYYFGIRTEDNSENWSEVSNIAWAKPYQDSIVTFNDVNLEAAIRSAISRPTGDIYRSELATLDSLKADSVGISDLTGLENCTSLIKLELPNNDITTIGQLSGLLSLTNLNLQNNDISDITPLSGLTNLYILELTGNPVGSIDALSGLHSMWMLSVNFTGLSNLNAVTSMPQLSYLFVVGNSITDLSPLTNCSLLNTIYADNNPIVDISPLTNLGLLANVWLRNDLIQDISPLVNNAGIGSGDHVGLTNNPLSDESINTYIPALEARGVIVTY